MFFVVFVPVNEAIFPDPEPANPIAVFEFTQENCVPVFPVNRIVLKFTSLQTDCEEIAFTVGLSPIATCVVELEAHATPLIAYVTL